VNRPICEQEQGALFNLRHGLTCNVLNCREKASSGGPSANRDFLPTVSPAFPRFSKSGKTSIHTPSKHNFPFGRSRSLQRNRSISIHKLFTMSKNTSGLADGIHNLLTETFFGGRRSALAAPGRLRQSFGGHKIF
jgi:hypothetical protein